VGYTPRPVGLTDDDALAVCGRCPRLIMPFVGRGRHSAHSWRKKRKVCSPSKAGTGRQPFPALFLDPSEPQLRVQTSGAGSLGNCSAISRHRVFERASPPPESLLFSSLQRIGSQHSRPLVAATQGGGGGLKRVEGVPWMGKIAVRCRAGWLSYRTSPDIVERKADRIDTREFRGKKAYNAYHAYA